MLDKEKAYALLLILASYGCTPALKYEPGRDKVSATNVYWGARHPAGIQAAFDKNKEEIIVRNSGAGKLVFWGPCYQNRSIGVAFVWVRVEWKRPASGQWVLQDKFRNGQFGGTGMTFLSVTIAPGRQGAFRLPVDIIRAAVPAYSLKVRLGVWLYDPDFEGSIFHDSKDWGYTGSFDVGKKKIITP